MCWCCGASQNQNSSNMEICMCDFSMMWSPFTLRRPLEVLRELYWELLISFKGEAYWPACSLDLAIYDLFLWDQLKVEVCKHPLMNWRLQQIKKLQKWFRKWDWLNQNFINHLQICVVVGGHDLDDIQTYLCGRQGERIGPVPLPACPKKWLKKVWWMSGGEVGNSAVC